MFSFLKKSDLIPTVSSLSKVSDDALSMFNQAITKLEDVNNKIDETVKASNQIIAVEQEKVSSLEEMKAKNESIKNKIQNILS